MTDPTKKRLPVLVRRRAKKEAGRALEARQLALRQQKEHECGARGHVRVNPLNLGRNVSYGSNFSPRRAGVRRSMPSLGGG